MGGTADVIASAAGDIFGGGAGVFGGDAFTLAASDVASQAAAGAISAADAISSGASVSDLISAGVAPSQLVSEGVASVPDLLSAGVSTSQLSADGLISTVGDGNIMDLATGNILDSSGQTILNAANEGLTSGSQITGATTDASGNIIQTFDDGSTLTTDAQGNVIDSTPATDTGTPPTDGTNPLSNPVVQKIGSTLAQKALSSLLAPATQALATRTNPTTPTTSGLSNFGTQDAGTSAGTTSNQVIQPNYTPGKMGTINPDPATFSSNQPLYNSDIPSAGVTAPATPMTTPTLAAGGSVPGYAEGSDVEEYDYAAGPDKIRYPDRMLSMGKHASLNIPTYQAENIAAIGPHFSPFHFNTGGGVETDEGIHTPEFYSEGGLKHRYVQGDGDGTSDDVPAMLANGEFVIPADVVSSLGNGSNDSGSKVLDNFLETIREHKQKHDAKHLPPDSKGPLAYLLEAHKKVKK